jgi:hypothetical protein
LSSNGAVGIGLRRNKFAKRLSIFVPTNAGDNRVRAKDVAIKSRYFEHFGSSLCSVVFELKR